MLSPGKVSCDRVALPNLQCMLHVLIIHQTLTWITVSLMCAQMFIVNACNCTWGCKDTVRESALTVDSGRKIPSRTGKLNLRLRHAGLTLYQLSYILIPMFKVNLSGQWTFSRDGKPDFQERILDVK